MDPLTLTIAAATGYVYLRGRTDNVDTLTQDNVEGLAITVCETLQDTPASNQTPRTIAVAICESIRDDLSWPPRYFATRSHKQVWAQVLDWTTRLVNDAAAAGVLNPCVYLLEDVFPLIPDDDETVVEVIPGAFDPGVPTPKLPPIADPGVEVPTDPTVVAPIVSDTPTPGRWYRIGTDPSLQGQGLLRHVGKAYGLSPGSARLAAAVVVNEAPQNRSSAKYALCGVDLSCTAGGSYYQDGEVISFSTDQLIYFPPIV
jgi:hypothetical protein